MVTLPTMRSLAGAAVVGSALVLCLVLVPATAGAQPIIVITPGPGGTVPPDGSSPPPSTFAPGATTPPVVATPTTLAPGAAAGNPDEIAVSERLLRYSRDLRRTVLLKEDPDEVLHHFDPALVAWFREVHRQLADINANYAGPRETERDLKVAALDALCRYGPPLINYRTAGVHVSGTQALAILTEGGATYYVPFTKNAAGDWLLGSFFFSEALIWKPLLIQDKMMRGEPLSEADLDFQRRGAQRFQESFLNLCVTVSAPIPQSVAAY